MSPFYLFTWKDSKRVEIIPAPPEGGGGGRNFIHPWIFQKTSSCPLCRAELPTSDPDWEEMRRQEKREKVRAADLEVLHDSMFG